MVDVDQVSPRLEELTVRYNAVTIAVGRVSYGHHNMKFLNNQVRNRTFSVVGLYHEGRSEKYTNCGF